MENKNGFTLVEMLSVLVILIMLALLIVPTVGKYINQSKTETFNAQLKSVLSSTQNWFNETQVSGTQINTNMKYLPSNSKGLLEVPSTATDVSSLDMASTYRVVKLPIKFLQQIGTLSNSLIDPKTNNNLGDETNYYMEIDYCGDNSWSYKMIYKDDAGKENILYSSRDCSKSGILTQAVQKYLDLNRSTLKAIRANYIDVSALELDSGMYSGSVDLYKTGTLWYYTYNGITTSLE